MVEQIIGVDCATTAKKVGVAVARRAGDSFRLQEARACSTSSTPVATIAAWVREVAGQTLISLDAPLGWPVHLGAVLAPHRAGEPIPVPANALFRRETDRNIVERFGKTPLDVGADRIARTAHWTLGLIAELSAELNADVPVVWETSFQFRVGAIEVYPAATLLAHGIGIRGYKAVGASVARTAIHDLVAALLAVDESTDPLTWSVDTLDAVICVLAGVDFVNGVARPPANPDTARKEGWIWVRNGRRVS